MFFLKGRVAINEIPESLARVWNDDFVNAEFPGFMSSAEIDGSDARSISSTCYVIYARDMGDDSLNMIVIEPHLFQFGPGLLQDLPVFNNIYNTKLDDARKNETIYTFLTYAQDISDWDDSEIKEDGILTGNDFVRMLRSAGYVREADETKEGKRHVYFIYGLQDVNGSPACILISAKKKVLAVVPGSKNLESYTDSYGLNGQMPMQTINICISCSNESNHLTVNFRNNNGDYVKGVRECQSCGSLSTQSSWR